MNKLMDEDLLILEAEMAADIAQVGVYLSIADDITRDGVCREDIVSMESIYGTNEITDEYPIGAFTADRTDMNSEIAMESIFSNVFKSIKKAMRSVWDFIVKVFKKLIGLVGLQVKADDLSAKAEKKEQTLEEIWRDTFSKHVHEWIETTPPILYGQRDQISEVMDLFAQALNLSKERADHKRKLIAIVKSGDIRALSSLMNETKAKWNASAQSIYQKQNFTHGRVGDLINNSRFSSGIRPVKYPEIGDQYFAPDFVQWTIDQGALFDGMSVKTANSQPKDIKVIVGNFPEEDVLEEGLDKLKDFMTDTLDSIKETQEQDNEAAEELKRVFKTYGQTANDVHNVPGYSLLYTNLNTLTNHVILDIAKSIANHLSKVIEVNKIALKMRKSI